MEKKNMILTDCKKARTLLVEEGAYEGVKRVAQKLIEDIKKVSGASARTAENLSELSKGGEWENAQCVLCATIGHSVLLEELEKQGKINLAKLAGKREVFSISIVDMPFKGVEQALVICGSDKLGTIYGMFTLSEYIGISPLCYFGDTEPVKKEQILLREDIEQVSKEPSVKYRGFFINDEWPCFGNWTFDYFGGFTAEMYDHVFEFLLRMKGNYLWPAMWTSSFPLDGPGSLNEELADIYGITVSYSHHEPCLRASEEWDLVRGEDSPYGNEWNFDTNKEGLLRYWGDGLARSGKYNHMITIGMRGERDSSILGHEATLEDNINLLKDVITAQRELIKEYVNEDIDSVPQLLALYKEVEAYFYGDEETNGLKGWEELENVTLMLCEDNFGHMRTLPTKDMQSHKGGFGMYYHLDYHGGPVSYEWMPSTPLSLVWEQMTQAYEYGIKDVWVVNVGDLKGNEVALGYFLALAYDFEKWGSVAPNSCKEYLYAWAKQNFPAANAGLWEKCARLYTDFVAINAMRRPETLHAGIYHPCHYRETDNMLKRAEVLWSLNEEIFTTLSATDRDAYYSMLYYPVKASLNLLRMQLYAGKNAHYAAQGRKEANVYGDLVSGCIALDKSLCEEFAAFSGGKWKGMELEKHIGFTSWNDDGWRYPVRMTVCPVDKPRMSVSRADEKELYLKVYGTPRSIIMDDFLDEGVTEAMLEIANDGEGCLSYEITVEEGEMPVWLRVTPMKGEVTSLARISVTCDRSKLTYEEESVKLLISDGDTRVFVIIKGKRTDTEALPKGIFLPRRGVLVMEAHHFAEKKNVEKGSFCHLKEYGRSGNGMKVFPPTADFTPQEEMPELTYSFVIPEAGTYVTELWSSPTNSLQNKRPLRVLATAKESKIVDILDADYQGGENSDPVWCEGVLNQIRKTKTECFFKAGVNKLKIGALEAGFVLERIIIYQKQNQPKESYLGPEESFMVY